MKNRLRELREEKRLTLRDMEDKFNITYSSVAMMERGERGISNDNITLFCNFFDVSADYLLGLSDIRQLKKETDQLSGFKLAMYEIDDMLSEENKQIIMDLAKKLADK